LQHILVDVQGRPHEAIVLRHSSDVQICALPSPVRAPTHPPRTGEGRHHPAPKTTRGLCAQRTLPFSGGGALSRSGRGRWHARGRVGEGAGGGKARSCDSAPPPTRPGGGKPLPYFGLTRVDAG
jgi:hypothetical protein